MSLQDRVTAGLNRITANFSQFGSKVKSLGQTMSLALTAPITIAGYKAIESFNKTNASLRNLGVTLGVSGAQMSRFKDIAVNMGLHSARGTEEVANAMQMLSKAGLSTENVLTRINDVEKLALGTNMDMATSAKILTSVMKGFSIEGKDTQKVMDLLAAVHFKTKVSIEELAVGFKMAGPEARKAGVSMEQMAAMLANMAEKGIDGRRASMFLRQAFKELNKEQIQQMFKSGNLTEFVGKLKQTGLLAQSVAQYMGSLQYKQDQLNVAWKQLGDSIMESGFVDILKQIIDMIKDFMVGLKSMNPELKKWVAVILMAVAAIGPLLIYVGMIATAIGAITLPVIIVTAAFVAWGVAIAEVIANWKEIKSMFSLGGLKDVVMAFAGGHEYAMNMANEKIPNAPVSKHEIGIQISSADGASTKVTRKTGDSSVKVSHGYGGDQFSHMPHGTGDR